MTRLSSRQDLEACAKILINIYNNNVLSEGWTIETALNLCNFYFSRQPDLFYVALKNDAVVGFTFSYIKPWADGNQLMVEEIAVEKENRKGGTAQLLVQTLIKAAIEKYSIIKVNGTTYEDEIGMPFKIYKYLGFTKVKDLFLVECDAGKLSKRIEMFGG